MPSRRLAQLLKRPVRPGWYGGVTCRTCTLPYVRALNEDIHHFAKAKAKGHRMPWREFFREHVITEYEYPYQTGAFRMHCLRCLGLKHGP